MKIRSQSAFPVLILALLAGLTVWLEQTTKQEPAGEDPKKRHEPDYMVEHFSVQRFDATGHPDSALGATRMLHYPDDDSTRVENPVVTFTPRDVPHTRVTAMEGTISGDGKRVDLSGDVVVTREASKKAGGVQPTIVRSPQLTLFPDEKRARTDARVTIEQGPSVLQGTGLEADNAAGLMELRAAVVGRFERSPEQVTR